ncbi:beta-glucosidase [Virgisporangium aliadipatigenens]|uniref:Beta-glucosidase n=1 Tax=Virgisporangium aliadipatigenens TaxID=741659 RepID=A0A8J3YHM3_9ACTN|nr:glycoside hydrolase family 3 C-terminal domain-containing protein [Virgisporangium aliadipatigenens]GIJ44145.1 beta-glucosidase [Virgisporangium aliadipatigenens]
MDATPAFRDPDRPSHARVDDLLGRLTLDEKIGLLHQYQQPVPRLGLEIFKTGTEALHGLAWLGPATVFPQAVGLASTWNPELIRAVGAAVGDEVRAMHHKDPAHVGLNVWAPVVNPLRDPRWGRNEEGWSEDPWLTGELATAYARGLRGDDPAVLKTAPTLKHFIGYNNETDRCTTSSTLSPRVLAEYDLPPFAAPLRAGAAVAVMASYNLVNGVPAHLSPLIADTLRGYAPDGLFVVGDATAVSNIAGAQRAAEDHPAGFAAALRAGIDSFTEDDADHGPTASRIREAIARGLITEADVDTAVRRALTVRLRLGEFGPDPYAGITTEVINCPGHRALAREAARQSVVLLKNDGVLPLGTEGRVAVLGPLADTVYEDWYSGTMPYRVTAFDGIAGVLGAEAVTRDDGADRIALWCVAAGQYVHAGAEAGPLSVSARESHFDAFYWGNGVLALRAVANGLHLGADDDGVIVNDRGGPGGWVVRETFRSEPAGSAGTVLIRHLATGRYLGVGADGVLRADRSSRDAARFRVDLVDDGLARCAALARDADVAVVVLGNHPMVNGRETEDRTDLDLPDGQEELLRAVHAANPRTVLVLSSSYPYAVGWADAHLPALLWSAHGGQEYGNALADVLFGAADPGGRLTQTWYRSAAQLPDLFDYDIVANDATYRYLRDAPLYPFGHGLSYTTFDYGELTLSADTVAPDGEVEIGVRVRNTGTRPGEEVVQMYTRQRGAPGGQPLRQLRGFSRVSLAPGTSATVRFRVPAKDLSRWNGDTTGRHVVHIGRSCADLAATAVVTIG